MRAVLFALWIIAFLFALWVQFRYKDANYPGDWRWRTKLFASGAAIGILGAVAFLLDADPKLLLAVTLYGGLFLGLLFGFASPHMNIVIFSILLIFLGLHALVYIRYLAGRIRSSLGLTLIFVLAFANVVLATSLVVPRSMEYGILQVFAAAVVAAGTAFGAYRAQSIASRGLAAYRGRPVPAEPSSSKQQSSRRFP